MKVVIIGNGMAGIMVASNLRQLEPKPEKLRIDIYSAERYAYYSRIRLPELFQSPMAAFDLAVYKPGWYEARKIDVHTSSEAAAIDRPNRTVLLRDGTRIPYDRLVLCTGADSLLPPIKNNELEGIFTIREYDDSMAVRARLASGSRKALVLGGGLLGLETARHLAGPGIDELAVVEALPRLLPKQLDETAAALLKRIVERFPARVLLDRRVVEFEGGRSVEAVLLDNGERIPATTVVVAVGIRPRIELARSAGLAVGRGVTVDNRLRTSDPNIYAAGDMTEFEGVVWGIIPAAMEHAPVVAANILGAGERTYSQTIPSNTLKVAGLDLVSMGEALTRADDPAVLVRSRLDEARELYEKFVCRQGRLAGCILLGSRAHLPFARERLGKPCTAAEVEELLRTE